MIKFYFLPPKKKKILIFDRHFDQDSFFKLFNKKECSILDVRYESINLFILLIVFFKSFFKDIKKKYLIEYIKFTSPKVVVTFIDNNLFFYELKNYYSLPIYIAFQNGRRGREFYSLLKKNKKKNFCADFIFIFGDTYRKKLLGNIKSKIISIGLLKNNFFLKKQKNSKIKSIVFISQLKFGFEPLMKTVISEIELALLTFLRKYCLKNKLKLLFFPKVNFEEFLNCKEDLHLKKLIEENAVILKKQKNVHKQLNKFNLFICLDSTLGYELLARKKKVIFLPSVNISKKFKFTKFGFPSKYKDKGFFWYNYYNENIFSAIINNIIRIDQKSWEEIIKKYNFNLMNFDKNNFKVKSILKKIV